MVGGVKALYAVLLALVLGVGCGKSLIADPIVEKAIREELKKPTGELTEPDLEKVTMLGLGDNELTEVPKGLDKLTQLEELRHLQQPHQVTP